MTALKSESNTFIVHASAAEWNQKVPAYQVSLVDRFFLHPAGVSMVELAKRRAQIKPLRRNAANSMLYVMAPLSSSAQNVDLNKYVQETAMLPTARVRVLGVINTYHPIAGGDMDILAPQLDDVLAQIPENMAALAVGFEWSTCDDFRFKDHFMVNVVLYTSC